MGNNLRFLEIHLAEKRAREERERRADAMVRFVNDMADIKSISLDNAKMVGDINAPPPSLTEPDLPSGIVSDPVDLQTNALNIKAESLIRNAAEAGMTPANIANISADLSNIIARPAQLKSQQADMEELLRGFRAVPGLEGTVKQIETLMSSENPDLRQQGFDLMVDAMETFTKNATGALGSANAKADFADTDRFKQFTVRTAKMKALSENIVLDETGDKKIAFNVKNLQALEKVRQDSLRVKEEIKREFREGTPDQKKLKLFQQEIANEGEKAKNAKVQAIKDSKELRARRDEYEEINPSVVTKLNTSIRSSVGTFVPIDIAGQAIGGLKDSEIIFKLDSMGHINKENSSDVRKVVDYLDQVRSFDKSTLTYINDVINIKQSDMIIEQMDTQITQVNDLLNKMGKAIIKNPQGSRLDQDARVSLSQGDVATKSLASEFIEGGADQFIKLFPESSVDIFGGETPDTEVFPLEESTNEEINKILEQDEQIDILIDGEAKQFNDRHDELMGAGLSPEEATRDTILNPPSGVSTGTLNTATNTGLISPESIVDTILPNFVINDKYGTEVSADIRDTLVGVKSTRNVVIEGKGMAIANNILKEVQKRHEIEIETEDFAILGNAVERMNRLNAIP